jgi:RNA polymerase sigma factor (sigma-70 family)
MGSDERILTIGVILDGVVVGDERATNQLYGRLWPLVFGYCYHRLCEPCNAEDAAQDAMEEIIRRAVEIRMPAALWRYSRLVAKKYCDRQTRRRRVETVAVPETPDGTRRDPLSEFLEQEDRRAVVQALWSLSPPLRAVVVLYYLDEYRTGEIAAFLGTSVAAVKKRLSDGRRRLRGRLAMVEGVMRDFSILVKMGNRDMQKLLREVSEEDLGHALHVVVPELRAKLERNVSRRVLERLRAIPPNSERAKESVQRVWQTLDKLIEEGEIRVTPHADTAGAEIPVAAMAGGPQEGDRAAWLRQAFHELSIKVRDCGLFALEYDAEHCADPLLKEGLHALVDGIPAETIRIQLRAREGGDIETLVEEGILTLQRGCLL